MIWFVHHVWLFIACVLCPCSPLSMQSASYVGFESSDTSMVALGSLSSTSSSLSTSCIDPSFHFPDDASSFSFSVLSPSSSSIIFDVSFVSIDDNEPDPDTTVRLLLAVANETVASFAPIKQQTLITVFADLLTLPLSNVVIQRMRDVVIVLARTRRLAETTTLELTVDVLTTSDATAAVVNAVQSGALLAALAANGLPLSIVLTSYDVYAPGVTVPVTDDAPPETDDETQDDSGSVDLGRAASDALMDVRVILGIVFGILGGAVGGAVVARKMRRKEIILFNRVAPQ